MTEDDFFLKTEEYYRAVMKAERYMRDNPREWNNWHERVQFEHNLIKQYLKEIRGA